MKGARFNEQYCQSKTNHTLIDLSDNSLPEIESLSVLLLFIRISFYGHVFTDVTNRMS